jgi:hypothetical protein
MQTLFALLSRIGKWLLTWLTPLLCVGLVLLGLIVLGKLAHDHLRGLDRYAIRFTDIDCAPPPGASREDFLGEVQYVSSMPDRLHVLDADLPARLSDAFARHPWVEQVERVEIVPPRNVRVRLVYRTPVLAVPVPESAACHCDWIDLRGSTGQKQRSQRGRAVDGRGILLPPKAVSADLPVLYGKVAPPAGPAGTPWGDPGVEAAARIAALLRPHRDRFHFDDVEVTAGGAVLSNGPHTTHIVWGQPPGKEPAGEAPAASKVQRLLTDEQLTRDLDPRGVPYEYDLRPRDRPARHPLH